MDCLKNFLCYIEFRKYEKMKYGKREKMNTIILTARFGMGHVSAAKAIKEELEIKNTGSKVYIIDVVEYLFPQWTNLIYSGFNHLTNKFSMIYNLFNKVAGVQNSSAPLKRPFVKKLDKLIDDYDADIIISTIPIASKYISLYKETKKIDIPLYTYITDITAHNEWLGRETNIYFVGSEETKKELLKKGVEEEKISITGIPVKQAFKNLHLINKNKKKELLIMGGGLGLIPGIENFLSSFNENDQINVTIICGKNENMYNKLKNKYPNINVVGFTNFVHNYMNKADLIVTKSGGITTFEAIYALCPLFIIHPFLVQEVGNAKYIQNNNIGMVKWNKKQNIKNDVINLINDEKRLNDMKKNMVRIKEEIQNDNLVNIISA